MKEFLKLGFVVAVVVALGACSSETPNPDDNTVVIGQISEDLSAKYAKFQSLIQGSAGANVIGQEFYWPEIILSGEGVGVYRGINEYQPAISGILEELGTHCVFINKDPVVSTQNLAAVYTRVTCSYEGEPDLSYLVLYIWERRDNVWKVIRENYIYLH